MDVLNKLTDKGNTVLVHSAAGGVGIWANRIAKKYDAFTIGSIGSDAKIDFCKNEGYDRVIVRSDRFAKDLKSNLEGKKLNIIMECIGGKIFQEGFDILAPQGRAIVYGAARYASIGNRPNYFKLLYQFLTRPKIDPQKFGEEFLFKNTNKKILGYGASTKGNVLLQYCGINSKILDNIAEVNKFKFNKFTPGTKIKIISKKKAKKKKPDYLLVLPWHFKDHIVKREQKFLKEGGKLIFPLPDIEII